jgi:hypothetical protein
VKKEKSPFNKKNSTVTEQMMTSNMHLSSTNDNRGSSMFSFQPAAKTQRNSNLNDTSVSSYEKYKHIPAFMDNIHKFDTLLSKSPL